MTSQSSGVLASVTRMLPLGRIAMFSAQVPLGNWQICCRWCGLLKPKDLPREVNKRVASKNSDMWTAIVNMRIKLQLQCFFHSSTWTPFLFYIPQYSSVPGNANVAIHCHDVNMHLAYGGSEFNSTKYAKVLSHNPGTYLLRYMQDAYCGDRLFQTSNFQFTGVQRCEDKQ